MKMFRTALAALALAAAALPAWANPYAAKAEARLLHGWQNADGTRTAALHITLAPGWKTYWRAPGDAGIPPLFDWSASRNLAGTKLHWPTPVVFDQGGMRSIGYTDELVLPITLTPKAKGQPMKLRATVDIGVCKDICVPMRIELSETIAPESRAHAAPIKSALGSAPLSARAARVSALKCSTSLGGEGLIVDIEMQMPPLGGREEAALETGDPLVWAKEPRVERKGNMLKLRSEFVHALGQPFALNRSALRLTLIGARRAVDIQGC